MNAYREQMSCDAEATTAREINSNKKIRQLLANLNNHEH